MKKTAIAGIVFVALVFLWGGVVITAESQSLGATHKLMDNNRGKAATGLSGSQVQGKESDAQLSQLIVYIPTLTAENVDEAIERIKSLDKTRDVEQDLEKKELLVTYVREKEFDKKIENHFKEFDINVRTKRVDEVKPRVETKKEVQKTPTKQAIVTVPDLDRDKARELGKLLRQNDGIQRMVPDYENNTLLIIYNENMDFEASVLTKLKEHNPGVELKESGQETSQKSGDNPTTARKRCPGCTGGGDCSHSGGEHAHSHD
jgi:hypothetical protein